MSEHQGSSLNWEALDRELNMSIARFMETPPDIAYTVDVHEPGDMRLKDATNGLLRRHKPGRDGITRRISTLSYESPYDTLVVAKSDKITFQVVRNNDEEPDGESPLWVKVEYDPISEYADFTGKRLWTAEQTELDMLYNRWFENPGGQIEALIQFIDTIE